MDVGGWLRNLGLNKYEAVFRENGIDEQVLRHVTAEDLREIGVATVGDRRKLLAAIAELAAPLTELRSPPSPIGRPKTTEVSAERRPIAVMFCDLVGSTSLSARLDAEDWRNLVSAYLDTASEAVTKMGGRVAKKLGDGLMALFGYPIAHENDSERAVRSALAIQRALAELNRENAGAGGPELVARIGVESGAVVVDAAGEIFGDAPNVAARVQALADPGTVLITARVQRQTAGLFVADDKGAHELKGVPEPIGLYRIVRASGGRRFGTRVLTPLVGREEELDLLRQHWERVVKGEGQLALVVGEPGIGKSRLVEEFRLKLGETPHTFVEWSSSQLLQNTPLHPIAEWGRQRFGDTETPAGERLADLENTLQLVGLDPAEHAPLIAPLVDIPLPQERAAKFPPEELRRRQLAALTAWYLAGARTQPAVLAFEDLHWADPTSLDLMQALAERRRTAPLFIIATARPEFRLRWSLRSHHSVISLSPLDRADVAQMVGELAARHALSQEVIEGVSQRTGGVPLFVEEVTRLLLERGQAGGLQAIPPTLQQWLAARLDRLGEAREVAQIGAVLGRDFTYALLRAVSGVDDPILQSALERLADADLLIAEGAGREANYRFKHALIQDAAYDSLLKSRRQALHRRAAELLRNEAERAAAEPEVIAHHFTEASLDELAIEWWGKAGDQALRRSAFQEAIAHLGKAIAMADKTAENETLRPEARLRLQISLSNATMQAHGQHASNVRATFLRARELAVAVDDPIERISAYYGLWVGSYMRGETEAMKETADAMMNEAGALPESPAACIAHRAFGVTCWMAHGDFAAARTYLEQAVAFHDFERDRELAFRFGQDLGVAARDYLALVLWAVGEVDQARAMIDEAIALAISTEHAPSLAHAYWHQAILEFMRLDARSAKQAAESCLTLARQHDLGLWLLIAPAVHGWAVAAMDNAEAAGWDQLRRSLEVCREQGQKLGATWFVPQLALAEACAGRHDIALRTIESAIDNKVDLHFSDSEPHRIRGTIFRIRDPASPEMAEKAYLAAVSVARQGSARSFELRAALGLAKLYQSTGRPAEAHGVLAPALEGFAPTPEMPEIAEAQALIERLASGRFAR
jgi:class 3 adenylate cyclase/tetratricopeptide (TPR) repeat protein